MSNKILDMKGRPLAASKKPEAGKKCLYQNGQIILFAEDAAVTEQGDEYVFDTWESVIYFVGADQKKLPPQRLREVLVGLPTWLRSNKSRYDVTDCTDETLLMQLRAVRAGLVPVAAAPEGEKQ